jgi:hypothetical protein
VNHLLGDPADRLVLTELEQEADGFFRSLRFDAMAGSISLPVVLAAASPGVDAAASTATACSELEGAANGDIKHPKGLGDYMAARDAEKAAQCRLLRDIFCNPFRPVSMAPSRLTSSVLDLTRTMYDSRDFAAMPILADALEEAGCNNPDILAHCRGDGPHIRGCWVVDLVLGKE